MLINVEYFDGINNDFLRALVTTKLKQMNIISHNGGEKTTEVSTATALRFMYDLEKIKLGKMILPVCGDSEEAIPNVTLFDIYAGHYEIDRDKIFGDLAYIVPVIY